MAAEYKHTLETPYNHEPDVKELVKNFITPISNCYDRNHSSIPALSATTHRVAVTGLVSTPLILSIPDLHDTFPQHTVLAALQCAGNRRHTMRKLMKEVNGVDWGDGAVMNCQWRGPRVRDVLLRAGLDEKALRGKIAHVQFACHQVECQDDGWYGGSIPLDRAMREDAEVILALEMNSTLLTPAHGFPIRALTPGIAGARCVKWLDSITVSLAESPNFYQQLDYKILPPAAIDTAAAKRFWPLTPSILDMPLNSIVAVPRSGETVRAEGGLGCCGSNIKGDEQNEFVKGNGHRIADGGHVECAGYALPSGDGGRVSRVQVSGDDGKSWVDATITEDGGGKGRWCWVLWKGRVWVERGSGRRVVSRATDERGNRQVERGEWNYRGVCYAGWGEARDLVVL